MIKNKWIALIGAFLAFQANAEHCPDPNDIMKSGHVYGASIDWMGFTHSASTGRIVSFKEALVYDLQPLQLQKCTYNLERGGYVDMFSFNNFANEISITPYMEHWDRVSGLWFDAFICRGQAQNCAFDYVGE